MWIVHFAFAAILLYVGAALYAAICRTLGTNDPGRWYMLPLLLVIECVMLALAVRLADWTLKVVLGLGRLPPCPRAGCGSEKHEAGQIASGEAVWKCKRCGQALAWRGGDFLVLDDDGRATARYVMDRERWRPRWDLQAADASVARTPTEKPEPTQH